MSTPYVGEVRLVGFNFAPVGWNFCNGALISIAENTVLFELIGTTYGGDGQNTYALPNLQSRIPVHQGTNSLGTTYVIGETGGVEEVTLSQNQYPAHTHSATLAPSAASTTATPANNFLGTGVKAYGTAVPTEAMAAGMVAPAGSSQPHGNLQPYLALNWIISLFGIFPSQN
jgi:microcystin-dependent protein